MIKIIRLINDDKLIAFSSITEDSDSGVMAILLRNPFLIWKNQEGIYEFEDYLPESDKDHKQIIVDPMHILYGVEPTEELQNKYNEFTGLEKVFAIKPLI